MTPENIARAVQLSMRPLALQALHSLDPGQSTVLRATLDVAREAAQTAAKRTGRTFKVELIDGQVVATRGLTDQHQGADNITATCRDLLPGQYATFDDANIASLRSTVSELGIELGDRFVVNRTGPRSAVVTRFQGRDAPPPGWRSPAGRGFRNPYLDCAPPDLFHLAKGEHTGLAAVRVQCSRYSDKTGYAFVARENVDGSITVRCYFREAMPPRWKIDGDHARLQEEIIAARDANKGADYTEEDSF